jgi:hypothetical protein
MGDMSSLANATGTLIVFDIILVVLCFIAAENLRLRLRSIPNQAGLMTQQLNAAFKDVEKLNSSNAHAESCLEELAKEVAEKKGALLDASQRLSDARQRLPTVIYVTEQLIQATYQSWLVIVRRGEPAQVPAGTIAAEWANGRRILVYSDTAANARRRIEARYPPGQGYRASDPQSFSLK